MNAKIDDDGATLYLRTSAAVKVMDNQSNVWIAQLFKDEGKYGFSVKADEFAIQSTDGNTTHMSFYDNDGGSKTLNLFNNYLFAKKIYADNIANMDNCSYMQASSAGSGSLSVTTTDTGVNLYFDADWQSDGRLKKNIKDSNVNALELLSKIQHRDFFWKRDNKREKIGYIAQELEEIDEKFVVKHEVKDNDDNIVDYDYTINERYIITLLTKAIQEQQETITKQQAQIDFLMNRVDLSKKFKFDKQVKKSNTVKDYGEKIVVNRTKYIEEMKKKWREKKNGKN